MIVEVSMSLPAENRRFVIWTVSWSTRPLHKRYERLGHSIPMPEQVWAKTMTRVPWT